MANMQSEKLFRGVWHVQQCRGWHICLLVLLGWGGLAPATVGAGKSPWSATVTHVTDGDTLWVQSRPGSEPRKIRLSGIDAPEICQIYGEASRNALTARVLGQPVLVTPLHKDDYGRLLARIAVQGQDVGDWMVLHGHAWSYHSQHSAGPYAQQEAWARLQAAGLWRTPAMQPSIFRRRHGSCH